MEINELPDAAADGDGHRVLFDAVYAELKQLAADLMRSERSGHTLRPTALVHEAYLRLVDAKSVSWENRAHFFGIGARIMRQILVDHAREKGAAKRGGGLQRVTLDEALAEEAAPDLEILDLDRALGKLGRLDERAAQVVELRAFGGLEMREIAAALGVSRRTVTSDWKMARMWLARELSGEAA